MTARHNVIQLNQPFCFKPQNGHSAGVGSVRRQGSEEHGSCGHQSPHDAPRNPNNASMMNISPIIATLSTSHLDSRETCPAGFIDTVVKWTACDQQGKQRQMLARQEMLVRSILAAHAIAAPREGFFDETSTSSAGLVQRRNSAARAASSASPSIHDDKPHY